MPVKVAILQSNYIPWKGYFDLMNSVDVFVLFDDMQYTRRDWRNRNKIRTAGGTQWLTIPVEVSGKYFQKINEVLVSEARWGEKHWRTLEHNYTRAPYFREYESILKPMYFAPDEHLSKINYTFIQAICSVLGIRTEIRRSEEFQLKEGKSERLVGICEDLNATVYYSGPSAKEYIDDKQFAEKNIEVRYMDYGGYPEYRQVYDGFDHFVTILDLLFNEGPNAPKFMKSFNRA